MSSSAIKGKVQTVLGPVEPSTLGPTTTHEHLIIDFTFMFREPEGAEAQRLAREEISLENRGWIAYNHYSSLPNLLLTDVDTAVDEAIAFKAAGGGTIVDATTIGIGRDPNGLARVARESGINVVMGAGFYVDAVHPPGMDSRTEDDLVRRIVEDIENGAVGTGVRAGIIGEVGCTWPLTDNERKSLRASAVAQRETGAAISIHPGRHETAPMEILEVLDEAGADIGRVIMGHLDRTIAEFDTFRSLAETGCYLEWDLFGNESSHYPLSDLDMPSDSQRMDIIKRVIDELDCDDRVVMAHDICTRHRQIKYGGHGYAHIFENIVPRMRRRGFSEEQVRALTRDNAARVLAFA